MWIVGCSSSGFRRPRARFNFLVTICGTALPDHVQESLPVVWSILVTKGRPPGHAARGGLFILLWIATGITAFLSPPSAATDHVAAPLLVLTPIRRYTS